MQNKTRMSIKDHEAVGQELQIARDALRNAMLIIGRRCVKRGELRTILSVMSGIIDLLRAILDAECDGVVGKTWQRRA